MAQPTTSDAAPAADDETFSAIVVARAATVRARPDARAPEIGLLRLGAAVSVAGCVPDCVAKDAWARLSTAGAVLLSALHKAPAETQVAPTPPEQLWYGRVAPAKRRIYIEPDVHSRLLARRHIPHEIACFPDAALRAQGWLHRVEGGYLQVRRVTFLAVSTFAGVAQPKLPMIFVRRAMRATETKTATLPNGRAFSRYAHLPLTRIVGRHVIAEGASLSRVNVSVIAIATRPKEIPADAKWVRVDLKEQTMTAYEGDQPVYATLVSSGKRMTRTYRGLYRVEHKMSDSDMHGDNDDPYIVDQVPYVLYFDKNEGLHGTYWHDQFGAPASHGCVNLSFADAKWLFDWSPPALPQGWSAINPPEAGGPDLWVLIDS